MGTVYLAVRARDASDGREGPASFDDLYVVKQLRADLANDPSARQAFVDEARLASALRHENVVRTHGVAEGGRRCSIEMEYLEGQTLEALTRRLAHDPAAARRALPMMIHVLCEALAGLHYAHDAVSEDGAKLSLVHRDVSPHNLFVTYDGAVKVLDFGVAKARGATHDTTTGVVKGKLTYMAPEQAARRPVDRRADLYSVGVVLWQALAARRLWEGRTELEIYASLERGDIDPPSRFADDVPPGLEAIAMRALARDPEGRPKAADAMREDLRRELAAMDAGDVRARIAASMCDLFAEDRAAERGAIEECLSDPRHDLPPTTDAMSVEMSGIGTVTKTVARAGAKTAEPVRRRFGVAGATALVVLVAALGVGGARVVASRRAGASRDGNANVSSVAPALCTSHASCGGAMRVCRRSDGACVALESARCKVIAEPGDVANDATVWIGTMFPTSGPDAEAWGNESVHAADLARRDFMTIARGVPFASGSREARPLGIVACDDAADVDESARHLVDLRVPAVVGFSASQEVIDLATRFFLPNDIVTVATQNQSALITTIPHPDGSPRLVWRTTISVASSVPATAAAVSDVVEPEVRAALARSPSPASPAGAPLRVALFRPRNTGGLSLSERMFAQLHFNGKSALENGASYREFVWDDDVTDFSSLAREIVAFAPHVVVLPGVQGTADTLLAPIERGWPRGGVRPRYVVGNYLVGDDFFAFLGDNAELRRRFIGVVPPTRTVANARLTMHYNDLFTPKVPQAASPGAVYDAMYLLAYGIVAAGDEPLTGTRLARGFARLVPPGPAIDVGPATIFDVLAALRGGGNVDLAGAATRLDFDLRTGDSPTDFALQCVGSGEGGKATAPIESNVVFRAATGRFEGGPLRCL